MKVYFSATPARLEQYQGIYARIGKKIEALGHEHTSRWMLDFEPSFYTNPRDNWANHYKDIIHKIMVADVAVWDVSVPSTTCGQCIQQALIAKKPVIVMQDNSLRKNMFMQGAGEVESKLLVVEYSDINLEKKLEEALEYVEDWLETRFTLILDGKTRRLLDSVAKNGQSRSEYIRELINNADFDD